MSQALDLVHSAQTLSLQPAQVVASWRTGVLSLPADRIPCSGMFWFEPGRRGRSGVWTEVRAMMLRSIEQWGEEAVARGWSTVSLFGVHREAAAERADSTGALVSVYAHRIVTMDERTITFDRHGTRSVFRGLTNPSDSVPIWAFRPAYRGAN